MENETYITGFNLVPFSAKSGYRSFTTCVVFFLYIFGVLINSTIITVIYIDNKLHTPMYLFLCNLALVDVFFTTTTVPNLMHMLISGYNSVSFIQCFTQLHFYIFAAGVEDTLIFIMAYDRYVAICDPMHYHHILSRKHCVLLSSATWSVGFFNAFLFSVPASHMSFCQSCTIHQFFCDAKALINISCAGSEEFYIFIYVEFLIYGFFPAMFSVTSYIQIIRVILQIKSKDGRKKAFSTCSSHLTIVIMYYMMALFEYMMPPSEYSSVLEPVFTILYSVVTPMINPLIYSLRNKDVRCALLRLVGGTQSIEQ